MLYAQLLGILFIIGTSTITLPVQAKNDTEQKIKVLTKIGIPKDIARYGVESCKATARDPVHCIRVLGGILGAESSLGTNCTKWHNCTGMKGGSLRYNSRKEGIEDWVRRYNKYWYKQKSMAGFYPPIGKTSKTKYCMSEESSGSKIGCPNGLKHASEIFNKIKF